jgi:iron complex outermembrane receptor protein
LIVGVSALALSALAAPSFAATAAAGTAASANDQPTLEEVIVVAEKRETSLQKIPVAVSVFTGKQRDLIGIGSVQEVTNFAPGFAYDPTTVHAYIRGVGRQSINVTDDQRVATYEDELYVYSPYGLDKSSLFLSQEQIERGPQNVGGRNAAAGSIDMISVRPTEKLYGEMRASAANYGHYEVEGAFSGPIVPGITARISGYYNDQQDGYFKNLAPGRPSEGGKIKEWYLEGQVNWKIGDNADLWVRAFGSGWNNFGDAGARNSYVNGSWNETNLTDSKSSVGGALFVNPNYGFAAFAGPARDAVIAAGKDAVPVLGSATVLVPGITDNPSQTNPRNFISPGGRSVTLRNYDDINANFTYHFSGVDFRYIGGVQGYKYTLNYDEPDTNITGFDLPGSTSPIGGNPASVVLPLLLGAGTVFSTTPTKLHIDPTANLTYIENDWWTHHEVALQSTSDSPLQWTAGLFYYYQHYSNPIFEQATNQPNFTHPYATLPSAFFVVPGNPATFAGFTPGTLAAPNPQNYLFLNSYTFSVRSEAVYGQMSYKFNDQFKITGNIRYSHDRKWGDESARYVAFTSALINGFSPFFGSATPALDATSGVVCPTGNPANCATGALAKGITAAGVTGADGIFRRHLDDSSAAVTGGAGVEWTPNSDTFIYGRYGRGYEALSFIAGTGGSNPEVSPEYLNSYEVGYKRTFNHKLTVDLAAFYYDYIGLQLPISILNGGLVQTAFINVPKAVSKGVELEATWAPEKDLLLTLSYSYDATSILTHCGGTFNGGVFVQTPGTLCELDTNDPGAVAPNANPFPGQTSAAKVQGVNGNPLPNAPKNKIAVNVAYTFHFQPGDLTLSGSWVWRDKQAGTVFDRSYDNAPSWDDVDLRAIWKGPQDKYEVIGYVKNVFNTLQYNVGSAGTALSGNTNSIGNQFVNIYNLAPPRTYGVEVRYKFF